MLTCVPAAAAVPYHLWSETLAARLPRPPPAPVRSLRFCIKKQRFHEQGSTAVWIGTGAEPQLTGFTCVCAEPEHHLNPDLLIRTYRRHELLPFLWTSGLFYLMALAGARGRTPPFHPRPLEDFYTPAAVFQIMIRGLCTRAPTGQVQTLIIIDFLQVFL